MNHEFEDDLNDDLLPHYDFAISDAFPTAESVNEVLRTLLTIAQRQKQTVPVE